MSRIKTPIGYHWKIFYSVLGGFIVCCLYGYLSYRQHIINPTDTTIPSFKQLGEGVSDIIATHSENELKKAFGVEVEEEPFLKKIASTHIWKDSYATYIRLFKGLGWGCLLSVIIGITMGCYESIGAFLLPTFSFLAKVPGTAMLAVFFVLAGTGETMFIAMIGFGIMPTLIQSIYLSTKNDLHIEEINKAYTLGASNFEVIYEVVLKQIFPTIIDSVRLQFGPAMVYLIAAEMLVGQVGMGYQIRMQQRMLNMSIVYDYILILGFTGFLMDYLMKCMQSKLCPWYEGSDR